MSDMAGGDQKLSSEIHISIFNVPMWTWLPSQSEPQHVVARWLEIKRAESSDPSLGAISASVTRQSQGHGVLLWLGRWSDELSF